MANDTRCGWCEDFRQVLACTDSLLLHHADNMSMAHCNPEIIPQYSATLFVCFPLRYRQILVFVRTIVFVPRVDPARRRDSTISAPQPANPGFPRDPPSKLNSRDKSAGVSIFCRFVDGGSNKGDSLSVEFLSRAEGVDTFCLAWCVPAAAD